MAQRTLSITTPRRERCDTTWRITATVDGQPLWFESDEVELAARPEAFLTALFIPALHLDRPLTIDAPIDAGWIAQTKRLLPIFHRWWGYPITHPVPEDAVDRPPPDLDAHPPAPPASGRVAQCFTGGIDSFYSLLRGAHGTQYLLYVHGFDIPLDDPARADALDASLRAVTQATGTSPIWMRTNLRRHPVFDAVSWKRTHGAALAAAGLLLATCADALVIPSSYAHENETPWGSHWDTDPLWSLPGQLRIIHDDASIHRRDKILELAPEPLAQRHLRVCWRNLAPTGNCSQCEKCLRTMTTLEAGRELSSYHRVFDVDTPLPQRLNTLTALPHHLTFIWDDLATRNVKPATRAAIRQLLRRSNRALVKNIVRRGPSYVVSKLRDVWQSIRRGLFRAPDES